MNTDNSFKNYFQKSLFSKSKFKLFLFSLVLIISFLPKDLYSQTLTESEESAIRMRTDAVIPKGLGEVISPKKRSQERLYFDDLDRRLIFLRRDIQTLDNYPALNTELKLFYDLVDSKRDARLAEVDSQIAKINDEISKRSNKENKTDVDNENDNLSKIQLSRLNILRQEITHNAELEKKKEFTKQGAGRKERYEIEKKIRAIEYEREKITRRIAYERTRHY